MNRTELKTPCFIIDEKALNNSVQQLKDALQTAWPNYVIGYSYKTNALPWVINYFREQGCYAEVVSDDEYYLAKSIGADNIIYNGIAKSKESFLEAVRRHSVVNIDAEYEIDWLDELENGTFEVGIRVNFDLERKCPGHSQCGEEGERFGFCYENGELKEAIDRITGKGVKISGLHLHKSSKTRMPEVYRAIAEAAVEIASKYDLTLDYIDIGGGFFGGLEEKPQFSEYFDMVSSILRKRFDPEATTIIVEPGMALIGANVDYITTVLDVKRTIRNTFVVTDGSRIHIDPLMTKNNYYYEVIRNDDKSRRCLERQIISGYTCMEHDRIVNSINEKELLPGDSIIYHKVGAYTMCLSPLFIKWFPEVYVKRGKEIIKVRNRWSTDDYRRGSTYEAHEYTDSCSRDEK